MTTDSPSSYPSTTSEPDPFLPLGYGDPPLPVTEEVRSGIRVLVVDDDRTLRQTCPTLLRTEGYRVAAASTSDEALQLLRRERFDVALVDLYLGDESGAHLMQRMLELKPDLLVVVMTGKPSVESSVAVLRAGAWSYVTKPFTAQQLRILVGRAAHTIMVSRESRREVEVGGKGAGDPVSLLGKSSAIQRVIALARRVAPTDVSVFITGESGTGKELVARVIHHHSRRSSRELVAVNCAAIPEALLESEMFGHAKGAFTGAVREKKGLLEVAHGGTLLLDELTQMPHAVQAKLLRVIQDGVLRRVGSTRTDSVVNVRFLAATNDDPAEAVREGRLRHDLHYRLRVVPIHIPPLRERPEDIGVLAHHLLQRFWKQHRSGPSPELTDEALRVLERQAWPGNVRELGNVIEHAVVLLEPGAPVRPDDLPLGQQGDHPPVVVEGLPSRLPGEEYHAARSRVLATFERDYLKDVVQEGDGNLSSAARKAGVNRTTLHRLMVKHGLGRGDLLDDA